MSSHATKILSLAEHLSPDETAQVAGELLNLAGVNRESVETLLKQLSTEDREELAGQVQSLVEEMEADDAE